MHKPDSIMLRHLGRIRDHLRTVGADLLVWDPDSGPNPAISYALLEILWDADALGQILDPDVSAAEWIGMPAAVTGGSPPAVTASHVDHPLWDFGPWLGEKTAHLKTQVRALVRDYCFGPSPAELAWDPDRQPNDVRTESLRIHLRGVEAYARVLYDQLYADRIRVESEPPDPLGPSDPVDAP
jgi:hypothetical protein